MSRISSRQDHRGALLLSLGLHALVLAIIALCSASWTPSQPLAAVPTPTIAPVRIRLMPLNAARPAPMPLNAARPAPMPRVALAPRRAVKPSSVAPHLARHRGSRAFNAPPKPLHPPPVRNRAATSPFSAKPQLRALHSAPQQTRPRQIHASKLPSRTSPNTRPTPIASSRSTARSNAKDSASRQPKVASRSFPRAPVNAASRQHAASFSNRAVKPPLPSKPQRPARPNAHGKQRIASQPDAAFSHAKRRTSPETAPQSPASSAPNGANQAAQHAEQERHESERQAQAEQSRQAAQRANQERADQERAERERQDSERAERERQESRERERQQEQARERKRDQERQRERDQARQRERDQERQRERDQERQREKERQQERETARRRENSGPTREARVASMPLPDFDEAELEDVARRSVTVRCRVAASGAASVSLISSSGSGSVDAKVLRAARNWNFSPALRNGVPVEDSLRVTVRIR